MRRLRFRVEFFYKFVSSRLAESSSVSVDENYVLLSAKTFFQIEPLDHEKRAF